MDDVGCRHPEIKLYGGAISIAPHVLLAAYISSFVVDLITLVARSIITIARQTNKHYLISDLDIVHW